MAKTQIDQAVGRAWWALVIRGTLSIAVGIFIIMRPLESVAALALVIALWALMQGTVSIVHAFDLRPVAKHWWLLLLSGIIGVVFGILALYDYPGLSLAFAVIWVTWWLLLGGISAITIAVQERRASLPWGWTMTWGILGVVVAIVAFATPPVTLAALMGLLSAFGIIGGIVLFVGAYKLRTTADAVAAAVNRAFST
jgi:uncharacterized membrane protein HdeD (DUF308 family)